MEKKNLNEVTFEDIVVNDVCGLFIDERIDKKTLPAGTFAYKIRGCNGEFEVLEESVLVDFNGTIITMEKIKMTEGDYARIEDYSFGDGEITFSAWKKSMSK